MASAQMGARGEVSLDAPIEERVGCSRRRGGFYGELAVGVGFAADVNLAVVPYIRGDVTGMLEFEEDQRFEQLLGQLFSFEWGGRYIFGDRKENALIRRMDIPSPKMKQTKFEGKPDLGIGNGGGSASNKKAVRGSRGRDRRRTAAGWARRHGRRDGYAQRCRDVIEALAAAKLSSHIASALTAWRSLDPRPHRPRGLADLRRRLKWEELKESVSSIDGIKAAGDLLEKHLPGWWNSVSEVLSGGPLPLDALFGADDRMRDAVDDGDHTVVEQEFAYASMSRWSASGRLVPTADANCIGMVFEEAGRRGHLGRMVDEFGGPDEFLDGWFSFFDDAAIKRAFDRYGIRY